MKEKLFVLLILLIGVVKWSESRYTDSLTKWTFTIGEDTQKYSATIPSSLSLDLVDNGLIKDPYYRDNFLAFYNYQTKDATYQTTFSIPEDILNYQKQYLIFEGLDTHASIYLNGNFILEAHNMFRRYEVQVQFKRNNTLIVKFNSSANYDLQQESLFKQKYGFSLPQNYSFTRKASYQYGWDWGPRILTVGIWKNVNVLVYNNGRIDNVRLIHSEINKTTTNIIGSVFADVSHLDSNQMYACQMKLTKKSNQKVIASDDVPIQHFTNKTIQFLFNVSLSKEMVWWTWDLGSPNLVDVTITLTGSQSEYILNYSLTTGFRTIKVIQENKTFNGTSYKFNLNGYDIYMRGGNYIPPEMSLARTNKSTYDKIVENALFGRFNMIRLWGGGQFEKDQFYTAMDQAGILIWHDLMFACALYPSSEDILKNIEAEMRDNVRRIRRHPSIAVWNGNNEVWIGWQQWGWKTGLTEAQKQTVQNMYSDVFKKVLPQVLKAENPEVFYWETSPSVSSNSVSSIISGDIHFWRVWGAGTDIEEYETYIGRFNSEYGMQSMPEMSSLLQFTAVEDRTPGSYILNLHERHPKGDIYLPQYTVKYSGDSKYLPRFAYYSQLMQAYALEMAIVSLRLNKPYNMGSLYWQLNDVWPVSSWSTVDYYGTYKAAHYRIREVYEELMIHTLHDVKSGDYIVYVVNEQNKTHFCLCNIKIEGYNGAESFFNITIERTVQPFERVMVRRLTKQEMSQYFDNSFIITSLKTTENITSSHNYFFKPMKSRPNYAPQLTHTIKDGQITITTDKLASFVWIHQKKGTNYPALALDQNYFTMTANTSKTIKIGNIPADEIYVTSYQTEYNEEHLQRSRNIMTEQ